MITNGKYNPIIIKKDKEYMFFFPSIFIENDGVTRSIFELIGSNYEIQIKVHTIILLK